WWGAGRAVGVRGVGSWRKGAAGCTASRRIPRPSPLGEKRQRALVFAQDDGVFWCGVGGHGVRPYGVRDVGGGGRADPRDTLEASPEGRHCGPFVRGQWSGG